FSSLPPQPSPNHLVSSRQHIRRYRQADLLGCLQIDDELELGRLLHWQIGRLGTFEDFICEDGSAIPLVNQVWSVRHKAAIFRPSQFLAHRRQSVLSPKLNEFFSVKGGEATLN